MKKQKNETITERVMKPNPKLMKKILEEDKLNKKEKKIIKPLMNYDYKKSKL